MLPRVILHNAISADGRIDWFNGDIGLYYELTAQWPVDAILSGSGTMLAAYPSDLTDDETLVPPTEKSSQLLVVVDSRGQLRRWHRIRNETYWRDAVVMCARNTPKSYLAYLQNEQVETIITGDDRVDLRTALEELNTRFGVQVVRVDSGGTLNGVLLRAGLIDEVSLVIHSYLVGGTSLRSIFIAPDLTSPEGVISLKLNHVEQLRGDVVWLRYEVIK